MAREMIHFVSPGDRYGRLEVVKELSATKKNRWIFCRCDCGSQLTVNLYKLVTGRTQSCGCLHREQLSAAKTIHGATGTPEYRNWQHLIRRCYESTGKSYASYGGRGIRVCDRWRNSFENFLSDMGPRPSPDHSIDRIDNNGNYDPENCRWATRSEQARNTRANRYLTVDGETHLLCEWSELMDLDASLILCRIRRYGWSVREAVLTPKKQRRGK